MMLAENRDLIEQAGYDLAYPGRDDIPQGKLRLRLRTHAIWINGKATFYPWPRKSCNALPRLIATG